MLCQRTDIPHLQHTSELEESHNIKPATLLQSDRTSKRFLWPSVTSEMCSGLLWIGRSTGWSWSPAWNSDSTGVNRPVTAKGLTDLWWQTICQFTSVTVKGLTDLWCLSVYECNRKTELLYHLLCLHAYYM